jgi:hypothetical protein
MGASSPIDAAQPAHSQRWDTARAEAFSDGVVAITLHVL